MCRRGGGLAAASRANRAALERLVRITLADAASDAPAVPRVAPLPRPGRLPLIAIALPIAGKPDFELGAVVLLRDPDIIELPTLAVLGEVFGLTRAEAAVAMALFADGTVKGIAAARRTSVNTAQRPLPSDIRSSIWVSSQGPGSFARWSDLQSATPET